MSKQLWAKTEIPTAPDEGPMAADRQPDCQGRDPRITVRDYPRVEARESHAARVATTVSAYDRDTGGDG